MAAVDPQDNAIVISIVYDGPPEAGKTTSMRALARGFGRTMITPEEHDGRTAFFDWIEHTGGRFQGAPIRCEIASVPGQRRWVRRRAHFLDRADVVVFVGDTRASAWPATLERLRDLRTRLDARTGTPVGVVFQANQRDRADALPIEAVHEAIASERIAVVESIAHEGTGVRETFVFGVRLALERVREEQLRGRLATGPSVLGDRDEVLGLLRQLELDDESPPPPPPAPAGPVIGAPRPPSPQVPSGCVWPPVEGRIVLGSIADAGAAVRASGADWQAALADGWTAHSWADAVHDEFDVARAALVGWARIHASAHGLLSRRRCIALAETGDGRWRLWQLIRSEPSLRELSAGDPAVATVAIRVLAEARRDCEAAALRLPCRLDTVGMTVDQRPVFVGLTPPATEVSAR